MLNEDCDSHDNDNDNADDYDGDMIIVMNDNEEDGEVNCMNTNGKDHLVCLIYTGRRKVLFFG